MVVSGHTRLALTESIRFESTWGTLRPTPLTGRLEILVVSDVCCCWPLLVLLQPRFAPSLEQCALHDRDKTIPARLYAPQTFH